MEQGFSAHIFPHEHPGLVRDENMLRHGLKDAVEFRRHHIVQQNFLRALGFADALVVRQVESNRLNARHIVAAAVNLRHHRDRRFKAAPEVLVFVRDRKIVFHVPKIFLVFGERCALFGIFHGHESFIGCFITEQPVRVDFIGADCDLDRSIQIHPGHFGFIVIVGKKRICAQRQEFFQRFIRRYFSGLSQQGRGRLQPFAVIDMIGNCGQRARFIAAYDGVAADESILVLRMGGDMRVKFLFRHIGWIERGARRLFLVAVKRLVVIERVPRAEMKVEQIEEQFLVRLVAGGDFRAKRWVSAIDLAQVNLAHQGARLIEQVDDTRLLRRQERKIGRHVDDGELRAHLLQMAARRGVCAGGFFDRRGGLRRGLARRLLTPACGKRRKQRGKD